MDFPIAELMDDGGCYANVLTCLHRGGCWRGEFCPVTRTEKQARKSAFCW
jgi:hypothetical protein